MLGLSFDDKILKFSQSLDTILVPYSLTSLKLLLMAGAVVVIYFLRSMLYALLERVILKIDAIELYSRDILDAIRGAVSLLMLVANLHFIVYIYNDFNTPETILALFKIIYTLLLTFMLYRFVNTTAKVRLGSLGASNVKMKKDLINVGIKILNSLIMLVGLLFVLFFWGVDLTAVLSGLGIGGIAVAFAAKDTISNFFGTLSILVSDVFSQGDWIEVNSQEGVVVEIGLRVTTLRTSDNALISIPNGTVANADVKNWSKRTLGRRIMMKIGVKYDSKAQDIKNAVSQIYHMLDKHTGIVTQNTPYEHQNASFAKIVSKDDLEGVKKTLIVHVDEFAPSSINILIYCFTKTVLWDEWLAIKEDVMFKIMEILEQNSLAFAFPSMHIYTQSSDLETQK